MKNKALWRLATLEKGKVSLPKSHQGRYPTTKLPNRGRFSFKDPLIMLVPNNSNDSSNNTVPMVGFIMQEGRKFLVIPKIVNRGRPRRYCKTIFFRCSKFQSVRPMEKNMTRGFQFCPHKASMVL